MQCGTRGSVHAVARDIRVVRLRAKTRRAVFAHVPPRVHCSSRIRRGSSLFLLRFVIGKYSLAVRRMSTVYSTRCFPFSTTKTNSAHAALSRTPISRRPRRLGGVFFFFRRNEGGLRAQTVPRTPKSPRRVHSVRGFFLRHGFLPKNVLLTNNNRTLLCQVGTALNVI